MKDEFCIKISNNNCFFQNIRYKCSNKLHPDYDPWKTPICEFEKCPLKSKYLPLSKQSDEVGCGLTSGVGLVLGMFICAMLGALLFGQIGFVIFAILGMILGDETEKEIIKYYSSR